MYKPKIQPFVSTFSVTYCYSSPIIAILIVHIFINVGILLGGVHLIPFSLPHSVSPNVIALRRKNECDIEYSCCNEDFVAAVACQRNIIKMGSGCIGKESRTRIGGKGRRKEGNIRRGKKEETYV